MSRVFRGLRVGELSGAVYEGERGWLVGIIGG